MRNQKGITLVSLVATVIVTIILAAVSTYAGLQAYTDAKVDAYVAKMKVVQSRVDIIAQQYNLWEGKDTTDNDNFNNYIKSLFNNALEDYKERNAKIEGESKVYPTNIPEEYTKYKLPDITDKGEEGTNANANNSPTAKQLAVEVVKKDGREPVNYYFFTPETLSTVVGVATVQEDDLYIAVDFVNGLIFDNKGVKSPTDNLTHYNHYFLATYDTRVGDNGTSDVDAVAANPVGTTQVDIDNDYEIESEVFNNNNGTSIEVSISHKDDNGQGIAGLDYTVSDESITQWSGVTWQTTTTQEDGKFVIDTTDPGLYYAKEAGVGEKGKLVGTVSAANKPKVPANWGLVEINEKNGKPAVLKQNTDKKTSPDQRLSENNISIANLATAKNDGRMYDYASGKYANVMDNQGRTWVWIPRYYVDGNDIVFVEAKDTEKLEKKSKNATSIEINKKLDRAFGTGIGFWVEKIWDNSKLNEAFQQTNGSGVKGKFEEFKSNYTSIGSGTPSIMSEDHMIAIVQLGKSLTQNALPSNVNSISSFTLGHSTQYSSNGNTSGVYCLKTNIGARLLSSDGNSFKVVDVGDIKEDTNSEASRFYRFVVVMDR